jgi:hypothetical protein
MTELQKPYLSQNVPPEYIEYLSSELKNFPPGSCRGLFHAVSPILRLAQIIGIAPIIFKNGSNQDGKIRPEIEISKKLREPLCRRMVCSAPYLSLPSISNSIMTCHLTWVTVWVTFNIKSMLGVMFTGTDLYAFSIQVQLFFIQSTTVLLLSFLKRKKLANLMNSLHRIYQGLNSFGNGIITNQSHDPCLENRTLVMQKRMKKARILSLIITVSIIVIGLGYAAYFINFAFAGCFKAVEDSPSTFAGLKGAANAKSTGRSLCPLHNIALLIEKFTYVLLGIYHQTICGLFCMFCIIILIMYQEVAKQLETIFIDRSSEIKNDDLAIEKLRIAHEKLGECCRIMGSVFGLPILGACVTSVVSITCSIYTILIGSADMNNTFNLSIDDFARYAILWGFHGVLGFITLWVNLISGQLVQNGVRKSHVL